MCNTRVLTTVLFRCIPFRRQLSCPGVGWRGRPEEEEKGAPGAAPIGSDAWCEELLGRRVGKARALLSAIGRFPDAHGAFSLLRSCSGWSKVLYSCRTVPPSAQMCGLRTADNGLRAALSQLIGRPLTEDDWRLASLGVAAGGLGARCAAEHAPAAYVASFSACRELCGRLWPAFDPLDLDEGRRLAAAEDALRGAIPSGASICAVSDSPSQKSLSGMVEARSVSAILGDSTLPRHRRLHLEACRVPGAGAWLTANPHRFPHFFSTFPRGSPASSSHSVMGSRHGLRHVRRSSRPLGRSRPCLLLWVGSGFAPQRDPRCGLLRGRRVHDGLS